MNFARHHPPPPAQRLALAGLLLAAALLSACGGAAQDAVETDPRPDPAAQAAGPARPAQPIVYAAQASEESDARIANAAEDAQEGDVTAAIETLRDVLDDDPKAFLAAYNLGVLLDQQGDSATARQRYQQALEIEPDFSPALINLVRIEIREGGDGLATADRHISQRPDNHEHKLARLEALLAAGRYDEIVPASRDILKADEANPRARYYMAFGHYRAGRIPLAQYIVDKAIEIDPEDPELHFLRGLILLETPDREIEARDSFRRAVELRGDYPEAQNALGLAHYRGRDWEAAEDAFRVALRYNPDFKEAQLNLGNALKAQGRGDEAEAAYLAAAELDQRWGDVHFALGTLYLALDVVSLSAFADTIEQRRARVDAAEKKLIEARDIWSDPEDDALVESFLAKVQSNRDMIDAEEAMQMMEGGGDGGGCDDPFGCEEEEGGGGGEVDPFADEGDGGAEADPFADEEEGGGEVDPFADEDK